MNESIVDNTFGVVYEKSIINCFTSISWDTELNELYIFCDSGRIVRPIFVLKEDSSNELISGSIERMDNWSHLIHGYMYTLKSDVSPYDNTYYKNELQELNQGKDFMKELEKHQSPIEYIDPQESNYSFIAKSYMLHTEWPNHQKNVQMMSPPC